MLWPITNEYDSCLLLCLKYCVFWNVTTLSNLKIRKTPIDRSVKFHEHVLIFIHIKIYTYILTTLAFSLYNVNVCAYICFAVSPMKYKEFIFLISIIVLKNDKWKFPKGSFFSTGGWEDVVYVNMNNGIFCLMQDKTRDLKEI